MKIINSTTHCAKFLHEVSIRRKTIKDWFWVHLKVVADIEKIQLNEIIQTLGFIFQTDQTIALTLDVTKEVVVVAPNTNRSSLSLIDKSIAEHFPNNTVRVTSGALANKGLEQITKIIQSPAHTLDEIANLGLKRFQRTGNVFLVLDDDLMVLKQMHKVLQGFGHVEITQHAEDFTNLYKQYVPNITFLDIHLKGAKGSDVLNAVKTSIDPYAYCIMISSDTLKDTVVDVKSKGADGFIMKPFDRDTIYRQLMRAPTFSPYQNQVA